MSYKLYTPEELDIAINQYFDECLEQDIFPDLAGMKIYLDISQSTYERYEKDEEMRGIIARARDRRESWLVRRMTGNQKLAQGCLNALKQPANGGYIDRPQQDNEPRELTINLVGVGVEAGK